MFVGTDENKLKRGRGWPIFKKEKFRAAENSPFCGHFFLLLLLLLLPTKDG